MRDSYDFSKGRRGHHAELLRNGGTITVTNADGSKKVVLGKRPRSTRSEGKSFLMEQLHMFGVRVEEPARRNGVDFFVRSRQAPDVPACPVVFKSSSGERVHIRRQDEKVRHLLLAFVWHALEENREIYAVPFSELLQKFRERPYTRSHSYIDLNAYSVPSPDDELRIFMENHRITSGEQWLVQMRAALQAN
jgi:hypothetical protein